MNVETRAGFAPGVTPEATQFDQAISIRPHHLIRRDVTLAFLKRESSHKLARPSGNEDYYDFRDNPVYQQDVFGTGTRTEIRRVERGTKEFFQQLRKTKDEELIKISHQPDGMCEACIVGKHCMAGNYLDPDPDAPHTEDEIIESLHGILGSVGFKEGRDYFLAPETYTVFDFGGRPLDTKEPPQPREISSQALLVRAGVLRNLMRQYLLPEE